MIACYDLACNPPTYDVVAFLAHVEIERLRRGDRAIELHILPGPERGFRRDNLWPYSTEERVRVRNHVLMPLCHLLPSAGKPMLETSRGIEGFGVGARHISLPAILSALRAGCRPLRPPRQLTRWPRLVTFTLREAGHHPARNSRVTAWAAAAHRLRAAGRTVVVVRDTARASEFLDGLPTASFASCNVIARAELYAQASLNVGICNGPMWLAVFMSAPVLMLRPTTNAAGGCYDDAFYASCGLPPGSQLPTSPAHQRLVWEDDTEENIVRAVEEMLQ